MNNREELLSEINKNMFYAKRHFSTYQEPIDLAESLIQKGFKEKKLNNPYIQNGLKICAAFITNTRIRNVIKLIEQGLREDKQ